MGVWRGRSCTNRRFGSRLEAARYPAGATGRRAVKGPLRLHAAMALALALAAGAMMIGGHWAPAAILGAGAVAATLHWLAVRSGAIE